MKLILSIIALSMALFSCSTDSNNDIAPAQQNNAPTVPKLVYPKNNLLCTENTLDFKWEVSTDSNNDEITYQIDVAKDNQFSEIILNENTSAATHTFTLEKGFPYYWRVKAIDAENASSEYSTTFSLFTEGEGIENHAPFSPMLIQPALNSKNEAGTLILEWTANDADGDALTYDVYVDTVTPPVSIVSSDQEDTTFTTIIESTKKYYWKIVAKDENGAESIGQIWTFISE
ncbi:hypothetical protein J8281_15480 [Aquimarina sp. U1-2]|uniref:glycoside hydrolase family 78 protein n=1 Tax=Aquimarina sp. U1-2 TaxID=2823141 RepID=UPI001AECABCB|nr:hypothetical protein [Aquimarina sp. U1-2]MBP2833596.1 hypothetical protein [Aquimarina sp. U1-2]